MYCQDYDETLPVAIGGPDMSHLWTTMELIQPYVGNQQIKRCPSDARGAVDLTGFPGLGRYSYVWNKAAFAYRLPGPGGATGPIMSLASIPYPDITTAFFDGRLVQQGPAQLLLTDCRHSGGANVAFLDGHAKWHPRDAPPPQCTPDNYHVVPE